MARFKKVDGERIQFTQDEEDQRDAEEKAWEDVKPAKAAMAKLISLEDKITHRRIRDAFASDEGKKWIADVEAEIAKERAKL